MSESALASVDDAAVDALTERIVTRLRGNLAGVALRAARVEALAIEAVPAIHALVFALSTDRAADASSLEHHETTAMFALLGRACALDGATPSAAYAVAPALLAAFEAEGWSVPEPLPRALHAVFFEGFVRGAEESARAAGIREKVRAVPFLPLGGGRMLVVLSGAYDAEQLTEHLESIARAAFGAETRACLVALAGEVESSRAALGPVLHFAELLASIGVEVGLAGALPADVEVGRGILVEPSLDGLLRRLPPVREDVRARLSAAVTGLLRRS